MTEEARVVLVELVPPLEPPPDFNEQGEAVLRRLGLEESEIEAWAAHNRTLAT